MHRAALPVIAVLFLLGALLGAAGAAQRAGAEEDARPRPTPPAAETEPAEPPAPEDDSGAPAPAQLEAGRQIYQDGTSPSGEEILAVMAGGTELPAAALPCSGCHGEDGRGKPEGGVNPTDLTWEALTRPYHVETQGGREHGPYTPALLKRSIAMGLDPAGNELHVAMPRYRMSAEDMEALVAYMRQLGIERDPGIAADRLRVGTLLPPAGRMDGVGGAIEAVLRAWAAEVDAGGGLYGREVDLVTFRLPPDPDGWRDAVTAYLEQDPVFALVGPFLAGGEAALTDLARERRLPVLGPFTLRPEVDEPVNPYAFYLFSGLKTQARALVTLAGERLRAASDEGAPAPGAADPAGPEEEASAETPEPDEARPQASATRPLPAGAVVYPEGDPGLEAAAQAALEQGRAAGWAAIEAHPYPAGGFDPLRLASTLATVDARAVVFLGSSSERQLLLQGAEHYHWRPEVYTPGSLAGSEALSTPPDFDGRLFLSFPTLPDDRTPEAVAAYRKLAQAHELPTERLATQLSTLAAARLLEEGVRRAGRDLSRSKLIAELEQLYKWDSGLAPLLTFTPNRRVGAQGAHVVALDLEGRTFRRVGWVAVEDASR
ncbi:MAG: ABC transporter substrate-binding protein [Thermoanaerobaculia bacterium]